MKLNLFRSAILMVAAGTDGAHAGGPLSGDALLTATDRLAAQWAQNADRPTNAGAQAIEFDPEEDRQFTMEDLAQALERKSIPDEYYTGTITKTRFSREPDFGGANPVAHAIKMMAEGAFKVHIQERQVKRPENDMRPSREPVAFVTMRPNDEPLVMFLDPEMQRWYLQFCKRAVAKQPQRMTADDVREIMFTFISNRERNNRRFGNQDPVAGSQQTSEQEQRGVRTFKKAAPAAPMASGVELPQGGQQTEHVDTEQERTAAQA